MRLGGDEFALYVFGNLFEIINNLKIKEMDNQQISISVGAQYYNGKDNINFDQLYRKADALLYESKKTIGCKLTI